MACASVLTIPSISFLTAPFLKTYSTSTPVSNAVKTPWKSRHLTQRFSVRTNGAWTAEKLTQASSESTHEEEEEDKISRATLIWRAIKLPIYSVALVPLTVGSAAAYLQAGVFSVKRYFVLLASSVLIITWLNLSNDVYDFDTGADKNKKESVVNLVGSRTWTLFAAYTLLFLGFMGLTWACAEAGNIRSILLLTCAIICGYIYQCPPFRLSYQGLGEPLCFAAFGPFATTAFYLLQSSKSGMYHLPLTVTVLSASLLVGFTTSLILFCSHFHQVDDDRAVGKMSPLVRIGTKAGSQVVKVAVGTLYFLLFALGLSKSLPLTCTVLCALTVPIGKLIVSYIEENHTSLEDVLVSETVWKLVSLQLWHCLSFGRFQMELCLNQKLIKKWKKMTEKETKEAMRRGDNFDPSTMLEVKFLRDLIEEFLEILDSEVFSQKQSDQLDDSYGVKQVNDACVLYCERFMEFLIDLLSQLPTRRLKLLRVQEPTLRCIFQKIQVLSRLVSATCTMIVIPQLPMDGLGAEVS